jgi:protein-disulfide isomerase
VSEYLFAGSTISLAAVFYLGYASFAILNRVCILCLVTYAAAGGLFLVSGAASNVSLLALPGRLLGDLRLLTKRPASLALAVAFVVASVGTLVLFPRETVPLSSSAPERAGGGTAGAPEGFDQWYASLPRVELSEPFQGADVVVVKFNDYQCPPCRQTYLQYQDVFEKYEASHPGRVRYVTRDFPLESECNAIVTSDLHPASCEAAVAVRLAREQGRDKELENWLFTNQSSMSPQMVEEGLRTVAGVTNFKERYDAVLRSVQVDVQTGIDIGARSTPTFVINGVMLAGGVPPPIFDLIIARELDRAGASARTAAP